MKAHEYYDEISQNYDEMYEDLYWSEHNKHIQSFIINDLNKRFDNLENLNLLDVGCGTGYWSKLLKEKYDKLNIHAIDPSEKMVELTKKNLNQASNISVGFGEKIPFDKKFDIIIAIGDILSYSEDPIKMVYEVYTKLNSNGVFIGTVDSLVNFCNEAFNSSDFLSMKKMKRTKIIEIGQNKTLSFNSRLYTSVSLKRLLKSFFENVNIKGVFPFPFENKSRMYNYIFNVSSLEKHFSEDSDFINQSEHLYFVCYKK